MRTVTFDESEFKLVPLRSPKDIWKCLDDAYSWSDVLDGISDDLPGVVTHDGDPILGVLLDDCDEGHHKKYGEGYFFTDDCIVGLYTHPAPDAIAIIKATLDAASAIAESYVACDTGEEQEAVNFVRKNKAQRIRAIDPQSILDSMK